MRPIAVFAALSVSLASCAPQPSSSLSGEESRRALLAHFVDVTALPLLDTLEQQAGSLALAAAGLEASAGADSTARAAARTAFATLNVTWQQLEVMHLGPAGAPPTFSKGQSLRDGIHSWPSVSPCSVDQQVMQNRMAEAGWASSRLVNVVGLHALDYLLFDADVDNACPDAASINAEGTWTALGASEVTARRAVYARVLADDLLAKATALRRSWLDDFGRELTTAGDSGSSFATAQQALDQLYAALFFVELTTKDRKLAVPAGLHIDCPAAVCPQLTESPFSQLSLANIEHNLRGARLVYAGTGDDGVGFDDLLVGAGHDDVAGDMLQKLDTAIAATTAFTGTLEDALVTEPQRVIELHGLVKAFGDELKSTMPSLLGLRVPDEGAGDND